MTFENNCGRLTKASELPIENEIKNLEHRRATWEASLSPCALFCSRRFPKGGMLMKNKIKRSVLYPIRAVLLLLVFALLFTGCTKEEPFYKGWPPMGSNTSCRAVRSETNVFDLDDVTLEWHFNVPRHAEWIPETGEIVYEPETPLDLYFCVDRENRFFIKRVEDAFDTKKRYTCEPEKEHEGGVWESYTVPREVFVKEKGYFYFVIVRPATEEQPEQIVWDTLAVFYEKIGKDRVRLDTWGAIYPGDTQERSDADF